MKLNLIGKVLLASIGAWAVGRVTNVKIRGSKEEIDAIINAMLSSKRFQDELSKPDATVQSVVDKLKLKNTDAEEFERILGVPFPI